MKRFRWLFWILVILFIWIIISRFAELEKLVDTLAAGKWQWVLVAALLQLIYYVGYAGIYQMAFATVEVKSRLPELVPVMFAALFTNIASPVGSASGQALFVDDLRRRGQSPARAAAGTLLVLVADFGSFLIILLTGIIILVTLHHLTSFEVIGALLLLLLIGGLAFILLLGIWRPDTLRSLLKWVEGIINRIGTRLKRPNLLREGWAEHHAGEFIEASMAISTHPWLLARTFLVAFIVHLIAISSLLIVFMAFHQAVGLDILVAGYSMGYLFWVVSITPQGIGFVETMMTLVFTSLGIPLERATVITLAFRGLSLWMPVFIGFILLRSLRIFNPSARPASDVWSLRAASFLTAALGIVNLISALTPSLQDRLKTLLLISPLGVVHGGRFGLALSGFALLLLAQHLRRRKRVAWVLTITVLVISAITHMIRGLDFEETFISLTLAGWFIYMRPHFHARSDTPSLKQGLFALLYATLFTLVYGIAGFYLLDLEFGVHFSLENAARQTFIMFTQFSPPDLQPVSALGQYFIDSIFAIALVVYSYAVVMLLRPVLVREKASSADRTRAAQIIEKYGKTSLAPIALLPDKSYYFSRGGSVINYVVEGRVALALGDPIGPPEDLESTLSAFQRFCAENDWLPAFYQVQPDGLQAYTRLGFHSLCIGQEASVNLAAFSLEGKDNKTLRNTYHKLLRHGYRAEVIDPPLEQDLLLDLNEISDAWLTLVDGSEMRFSVGWFDETYIGSCRVMVVYDQTGSRVAFANLLSEFGKNEALIDLMRHRPEAENGVMDFLFVALFNWAHSQGYDAFCLGLSGLSGVGEKHQDPLIEQTLHYIFEHVDRFYNFKGLHQFKMKFHPEWSPRYLVYPDLASLPLVTLALIRADTGEELLSNYFKR